MMYIVIGIIIICVSEGVKTHIKYLQYVRRDDHLDCGPVVRRWQLQFLIVFVNTELVGAMSSVARLKIGPNRVAWYEAGTLDDKRHHQCLP